jgi:probable HAF family extracellular repeat protein
MTADGQSHAFLWRQGQMIDLGTLGGVWSEGLLIDAHGRVAGNSETASGDTHAFFWEQGQMIDLGTLGGFHISSLANAMNDHGQVVGSSWTAGGRIRAVLWTVTCPHPEHARAVE